MKLIKLDKKTIKELIEIRRELHKIPELGFQELKTSELLCKALNNYGIESKVIAKTGIVGNIIGEIPGNTILLRADMDALPIMEKNKLSYKSTHNGKMHACGHDGHMAILIVTLRVLNELKNIIKGNIKFVFQPAEEQPGGAKPMIDAGVLDNPKVDAFISCHLWNYLPIGQIGLRSGPLMASVNKFNLNVYGKSSHGAMPQDGVDAIIAGCNIVNSLQLIISREISPLKSCVITVGKINGGSAFNVIADKVEIEGTVRTLDKETNDSVPVQMERIIKNITRAIGAKYNFNYQPLYPVVINNPKITELVSKTSEKVVGKENVIIIEKTMVGEDSAFFLNEVPGCFFFIGSSNKEKNLIYPHHNPYFNFDEESMEIASTILINCVLDYLGTA